jgi:hypothetical protein
MIRKKTDEKNNKPNKKLIQKKRRESLFKARVSAIRWKNEQLGNKNKNKQSGLVGFMEKKGKSQKASPLHKVFPEQD